MSFDLRGQSSNIWPAALLLCSVVLLVGCGDDEPDPHAGATICASETRADTYEVGLEKVGKGGLKTKLLLAEPAPPAKGDNTWTLQVLDGSNAPLDGLTVDVSPFMPDHGHPAPITPVVKAEGSDGKYLVESINLPMPGLWEVTLDIDDGAGITDSVLYSFCIEG